MAQFVKVLTLRNEIEASVMDLALCEREIPHRMRSYHDSAYDGLYQAMKGWGHIEAPQECAAEIKEIYAELTSASGECQDAP